MLEATEPRGTVVGFNLWPSLFSQVLLIRSRTLFNPGAWLRLPGTFYFNPCIMIIIWKVLYLAVALFDLWLLYYWYKGLRLNLTRISRTAYFALLVFLLYTTFSNWVAVYFLFKFR